MNLLSNALKFTSTGFIKIKAKKDEYTDTLKFAIRDTGIGIAEED